MLRRILLTVLLLSVPAFADTQIATDNFTRANAANLGANWTDAGSLWSISSNKAFVSGTTGNAPVTYTGASFSSDQYVIVKAAAWKANIIMPAVRLSGSNTGYWVNCSVASAGVCTTVILGRGTNTTLQTISGVSIGAANALMLKVSGTTLSVWVDGVQKGTDTTSSTYSTGTPGMGAKGLNSSSWGVTYWEGGNIGSVAADPTFSPTPPQAIGTTITIDTITSGCSGNVKYTTDGTDPSSGNGTVGTSYVIAGTVTLKARVVGCSGYTDSNVATSTYNVAALTTFSPAVGSYFAQQSITLACASPSSSIYYTTDGSTPTTGSTLYSGAFNSVSSGTEAVKALCTSSGYANSPISTGTYYIDPTPTIIATDNFAEYWVDHGVTNALINDVKAQRPFGIQADGRFSSGNGRWISNVTAGSVTDGLRPGRHGATGTTYGVTAVLNSGNLRAATYIAVSFSADQSSKVDAVTGAVTGYSSTGSGVCVRCSTTPGVLTGYFLQVLSNGNVTLSKAVTGSFTTIATGTSTTPTTTVELRVAGSVLKPLVNGVTPTSMSATYTDATIATGNPGIAAQVGAVENWSGGNLGAVPAIWTASVNEGRTDTPASNVPYTNVSSFTETWPWTHSNTPYTTYAVGDGTYALGNTGYNIDILHYEGNIGDEQWIQSKIGVDATDSNLDNWFLTLQSSFNVSGASDCYDSQSYYVGTEPFTLYYSTRGGHTMNTGCPSFPTAEYCGTNFLHITKATPQSSADTTKTCTANPNYNIWTVAGSAYSPMRGDTVLATYKSGHIKAYCKRGIERSAWAATTAYSLNAIIVDPNGGYERAVQAGTSGGTIPSSWNVTPTSTTTDGTVLWAWVGNQCPTNDRFSLVMDALDNDLRNGGGFPGVWAKDNPSFQDITVGSAIDLPEYATVQQLTVTAHEESMPSDSPTSSVFNCTPGVNCGGGRPSAGWIF